MLGRIALRLATVEALKGATLVGANVLDSQIAALDVAADGAVRTDQEKPFVAVYTDAASIDDRLDIRALHRSGLTDLTIETGITMSMGVTDPGTGVTEVIPGLPATDPAFEFFLDCVGRQITTALSDPRNAWAEIWRGLSSGIVKIARKRTSDAASGTRIAAHQLVITVDLLPDPVFGEPIAGTSIWAKFLAALQADNHPYREAIAGLVGQSDGVLKHEAQRRRFGMTLDEARALSDIAVQPGEPTEPDLQSATSVDQIGV
jgi:hypothetical protein